MPVDPLAVEAAARKAARDELPTTPYTDIMAAGFNIGWDAHAAYEASRGEEARPPASTAKCKCGHTAHWHAAVVYEGEAGEGPLKVPQGAGYCEERSEDGSPCGCEQFEEAQQEDGGRRDALIFARAELHRALLERGSTVGYRASFERINAALAASAIPEREADTTDRAERYLDECIAFWGLTPSAEERAAALEKVAAERRKFLALMPPVSSSPPPPEVLLDRLIDRELIDTSGWLEHDREAALGLLAECVSSSPDEGEGFAGYEERMALREISARLEEEDEAASPDEGELERLRRQVRDLPRQQETMARLRYEAAHEDDEGCVAWGDTVESVRNLYRSEVTDFINGAAVESIDRRPEPASPPVVDRGKP